MHRLLLPRRGFCNRTAVRLFRGFTLVELLVAVGILVLLMVVTVVSVNFTRSSDRIKGTARQVQSYLAGARDRAIYSKAPRGVRLLLDPNNTHQVNGMIYIGTPDLFTDGIVTGESRLSNDVTGQTLVLPDESRVWETLFTQGYLGVGARIQVPKDTGSWYRVSSRPYPVRVTNVMADPRRYSAVKLDRPCEELAGNAARVEYALELKPMVLPGAEPVTFPQGVVIDLDGSAVPNSWRPSNFTGSYSPLMDILFSPRGNVVGDAAVLGQLHLLVADLGDSEKWSQIPGRSAGDPSGIPLVPANNPLTPDVLTVENDQILVSVSTRIGRVTTHPVNPTNTVAPAGLAADDPYRFSELGEVLAP